MSNTKFFCPDCGAAIPDDVKYCENCGATIAEGKRVTKGTSPKYAISDKKRSLTIILCFFFGIFGAHRFYVEKKLSGIVYVCTFGLLAIGMLVDLLIIIFGEFTDGKGLKIVKW